MPGGPRTSPHPAAGISRLPRDSFFVYDNRNFKRITINKCEACRTHVVILIFHEKPHPRLFAAMPHVGRIALSHIEMCGSSTSRYNIWKKR